MGGMVLTFGIVSVEDLIAQKTNSGGHNGKMKVGDNKIK